MNKQGNQNSPLLDSFLKIASTTMPKAKAPFNITASAKQPTIEEIFNDVVKNSGKNINRTAQIDSLPTEVGTDTVFDDQGSDIEPGLGEEGLGLEDGLGGLGEETTEDTQGAKQGLVDALIALCGSADAACECINSLSVEGSPEEEIPGMEPELEPGISEEIEPGIDAIDEEPSPMQAPPMSPMPMM